MHVVTLLSGGLDSTVLLYDLLSDLPPRDVLALSFDYGQRHSTRELEAATAVAREAGVEHQVVDLHGLGRLLEGSALTDGLVDVPEGHYTDASMRVTIVPNRNAILLSIAAAVAIARGAPRIAYGAHAGDHAIYPDCRAPFVQALNHALCLGNDRPDFKIHRPFLTFTKAEIVEIGAQLHVPFDLTWSCYKGRERHCGRCATCLERKEAFALGRFLDPTTYDDARSYTTVLEELARATS